MRVNLALPISAQKNNGGSILRAGENQLHGSATGFHGCGQSVCEKTKNTLPDRRKYLKAVLHP